MDKMFVVSNARIWVGGHARFRGVTAKVTQMRGTPRSDKRVILAILRWIDPTCWLGLESKGLDGVFLEGT